MRGAVEAIRPRVAAVTVVIMIALTGGLEGCGSSSPATQITPPVPPVVTTQPKSQAIGKGQTATMSVTLSGTAPLSYQWYQGASGTTTTPISGAINSSYTTPPLNSTTSYWVKVSNDAGSANSNAATITVGQPPPNGISAAFYGFTVNKACSISDTGPTGTNCNNPESHSFPGLPFGFSRSLGSGDLTWSALVRCDPTGSVCGVPGTGCSPSGAGTSCQTVAGCAPNTLLPTDPNNCAYDWTGFDFWTKLYNSHSVEWMYDAYYTPDYLSVRGSRCTGAGTADFGPDATCVGAADPCKGLKAWGCDPPADIDITPGSGLADGTDQNYKWFVTALLAHMAATTPVEHIEYWEIWNEPNICFEWNHSDETGMDCPTLQGGPSTGSAAQLARMAQDARGILPSSVKITTPPVTDAGAMKNYLSKILAATGASSFDVIGFHGYFNANIPGGGGCPSTCPTPEAFLPEWSALASVMASAGVTAKPAMDTEFSWGESSNVTDPDMRAAFAARSYLLHESEYPALARVNWYGEDFPVTSTGGTGEFWAWGATNVADQCTVADSVQGGFDCPAGLAVKQVAQWTIGAAFAAACSCSASPNGGSCTASPPIGIFQCTVTQASGKPGLFVWDNTAVTFPCSNGPCGSTTFNIPSGLGLTNDWQDLNGNTTSLNGATTVTVGAKPMLIE